MCKTKRIERREEREWEGKIPEVTDLHKDIKRSSKRSFQDKDWKQGMNAVLNFSFFLLAAGKSIVIGLQYTILGVDNTAYFRKKKVFKSPLDVLTNLSYQWKGLHQGSCTTISISFYSILLIFYSYNQYFKDSYGESKTLWITESGI